MKLKNYDLLLDIRSYGVKPRHVVLYMYPVKILPIAYDFMDTDLCTRDEDTGLDEYELDALRDLDVCLVGHHKDDRLRNACRSLLNLASSLVVSSDEHSGVDIWQGGKWV